MCLRWAWIQFASALERVCLPVGGLGYSSERVHLNGCAYQLVGLDTVPGALERVRVTVHGLRYSSERVHLNGCAYQLVGFHTVLSRCTCSGVLTSWQLLAGVLNSWQLLQQNGQGVCP